jgi:predicted GNAT family acetyltransferase
VRGTRSSAQGFVDAWTRETGATAELTDTETLYRLGALRPPRGVPGWGRLADHDDTDLLVRWLDAFFADAFGAPSDPAARRRYLDEIVEERGRIVLWTVDGEPVSMARLHAPLAGMTRIGPVYTPPEHRGRGHAAAVTSMAAEDALRRGVSDIVLFADADNPVSNRLYQRIGFDTVTEHLRFDVCHQEEHRPRPAPVRTRDQRSRAFSARSAFRRRSSSSTAR